jgi:hypothetical protein
VYQQLVLPPVVEVVTVWLPTAKVVTAKVVTAKVVTAKVAMAKVVTAKLVMGPLGAVPGSMGWAEERVRRLRTLPGWLPSCAV